ncbi:hypothetical protein [Actinacidiphila rubida]|uniref:DUF4232 domain-containing protein n=1 Tax=Actinacidiphila rubida TaxID=310780 RepID=A0A1H8QKD0_9ACTN|nr:hypothetical protein [Actinacidiphila rubida]SEO54364.1 hypothetical protein SAMN05216267_103031 [Actinacidiphila rubida]
MRFTLRAATVGAAAAALLLGASAVAGATIGSGTAGGRPAAQPRSGAPTVRPCTMDDVSFYFGGLTAGLSRRSFDVTLLAHDGITCTLKDTPLITVAGPAGTARPIPVSVNGRGGTLVLRPDSPLHTTAIYSAPDTTEDTIHVSTLTLSMPDRTSRSTYFAVPGVSDIYKSGVSFTSWTTGIGLGEGEEAY